MAGEVADSLVLGGQLFAALSQQTVAGTVIESPRLGGRATARYISAPTDAGTFGLRTDSDLIFYPGSVEHPSQFGVSVAPSWRKRFGPLRATLNFDHQTVLGTSPFTKNLDRLAPRSVVGGSLSLTAAGGVVSARGRYAFELRNARNPVRLARLEFARPLPLEALTLRNRLTAEVAGLLGPADRKVDAFVSAETRFDLPTSELELGFKTRYNLLPTEAWSRAARGVRELSAHLFRRHPASLFGAERRAPIYRHAAAGCYRLRARGRPQKLLRNAYRLVPDAR